MVALLATSLQLFGCGDHPDFIVSRFDVNQISWDSLTVTASFGVLSALGSEKPVIPEETRTTVFTSAYDTLYSGTESVIVVPDVDLGDRETLLVEVCGLYRSLQACEQQAVNASPKRMEPVTELQFPETEAYDRGSFRLDYRLYRQVFGSEDWEVIQRRISPETYLMAYVVDRPQDAVKIPVRKSRNRFNLTRDAGYRDFRYQIKSHFMDADSAQVAFDLFARLGALPERIATESVVLRAKSEEQRRADLQDLVELAASQILDRMKGFFGLRSAYVFINEWSYQPLNRLYTAEVELHWQSGIRGEWYDMIGELTVNANGTAAQFEWVQGSTSAARRWVARMDSSVVFLESLRPDNDLKPSEDRTEF